MTRHSHSADGKRQTSAAPAPGWDRRRALSLMAATPLVFGLVLTGGCGKRGAPQPPSGDEAEYPRTYPPANDMTP